MQIQFLVQGLTSEPYEVTFIKDDYNLYVTCTCPAGEVGNLCKHRVDILKGETQNIVSDNKADVETIKEWLSTSYLDFAFASYLAAEKAVTEAKERFILAKKELTQTMTPPLEYDHDSDVVIIKNP